MKNDNYNYLFTFRQKTKKILNNISSMIIQLCRLPNSSNVLKWWKWGYNVKGSYG